jgi:hypothetical protein
MGSKKRRNGQTDEPVPAAPTPIAIAAQPPITNVDLEAMLQNNPVARLEAQNIALRRTLAAKETEILVLAKRLGTKTVDKAPA